MVGYAIDVKSLSDMLQTNECVPRGMGTWSANVISFIDERLRDIGSKESLQHLVTLASMVTRHHQDHPCGEWQKFATDDLLPLLLEQLLKN